MTAQTTTCAMYLCDEPMRSTHGNAVYCSRLCRNRYSKLLRTGEIRLHCPRCDSRDYVLTLDGDESCLRCGYATGDTLCLDGIRIIDGKYKRVL